MTFEEDFPSVIKGIEWHNEHKKEIDGEYYLSYQVINENCIDKQKVKEVFEHLFLLVREKTVYHAKDLEGYVPTQYVENILREKIKELRLE